tara:strand:- start:2199 stop:2387 length:189 start_codon:yes stop_codon:yes gene_type:complete
MRDNELSPADQATLKYLRQQVDNLHDQRYRLDSRPSIHNELQYSIKDLQDFTSSLRKQGKNI